MPRQSTDDSRIGKNLRVFFGMCFCASLIGILGWVSALEAAENSLSKQVAADPIAYDLPDESFQDFTDLHQPYALTRAEAKLRRGRTLALALIDAGADRSDAFLAVQALYDADLINPRKLQIGLTTNVLLGGERAGGKSIEALTLSVEAGRQLLVKRSGDRYLAAPLDAVMAPVLKRVTAPIEYSLYESAINRGAGDEQIASFASAFAFDIDFQREIYPGDVFEMVFPSWQDERGRTIKAGELVYAELRGAKKTKAYYRHTPSDDGIPGWYDQNGESATRFLMKTPINGARLSSSFGRRRHPISGYTRLHKGTDFAAPTGTPVYAAGDGIVERASRYGGYGKYVRIRHANGYKTAYAHLSSYGRGAKKGRRVTQGQIIGYVGSTGASTGPHLHYEVMINGRHVNAMALDLPTGRKLAETEGMLAEFEAKRAKIDEFRHIHAAESVDSTTGGNTLSNYNQIH